MRNGRKTKTERDCPGFVSLVGAGPGNPKLITVRGREALEACDAVVYDHLVDSSVLRYAKRAECIYVGKEGGNPHSASQESIESLLIRRARRGQHVVRLKGGDPFVFGRGGEEALALAEKGIRFEVVPGVTSGVAACAYAGIPVTHRGLASEVTFITAHQGVFRKHPKIHWKAVASMSGTLVLYMGMKMLPGTVRLLLQYGKSPQTLATAIRWGTTPAQRVVTGTLETIVDRVTQARLTSPILVVIGSVNQLRSKLKWFETKPLFGKTILVTRPEKQAHTLSSALTERGAQVVELPTIQIAPVRDFAKLDKALRSIRRYDWLVFTSENGVEMFFKRLNALQKDSRILSGVKIAVIGPATRLRLMSYGVRSDLMPSSFTTEGLLRAFRKFSVKGKKILLLRTDIAPEVLRTSLEDRGASVTEIPVYRTCRPPHLREQIKALVKNQPIDYVTFTSASTAENFYQSMTNGHLLNTKVISIGPTTSEAIKALGGSVDREARRATICGLVEAIEKEERCALPSN